MEQGVEKTTLESDMSKVGQRPRTVLRAWLHDFSTVVIRSARVGAVAQADSLVATRASDEIVSWPYARARHRLAARADSLVVFCALDEARASPGARTDYSSDDLTLVGPTLSDPAGKNEMKNMIVLLSARVHLLATGQNRGRFELGSGIVLGAEHRDL